MKMQKIQTAIIVSQILLSTIVLGQGPDTSIVSSLGFRTLFNSAGYHMTYGSYNLAVPVYKKLEKLAPENANIQYRIGYCYLRYADDKSLAIPYLENAVQKATRNYNDLAYTEQNAPERAYYELARAYHFDNKLKKAIKTYQKYESTIKVKHYMREEARRQIEMCEYAKLQRYLRQNNYIITNLGDSINSSFGDYTPALTANEKVLILTSRRKGSTGGPHNLEFDDRFFEDVYISHSVDSNWSIPTRIGSGINGNDNDAVISVSPDGQILFTHSGGDDEDIYISYLMGEEWTSPEPLGPTINTEAKESHASLSANGKLLYFSRDVETKPNADYRNMDLFVSSKLKDGSWSEARNLGSDINSKRNDDFPFIHPSGTRLYFSSIGHESMGGYDIFYSDMEKDSSWSEPVNMDRPLNTTHDDIYYVESADGQHAYYSTVDSKKGIGKSDLYRIDILNREEVPLTMISGVFEVQLLDGIALDMNIYVVNLTSGEEVTYNPNTTSGEFLLILTAGSKYYITYETGELILAEENIDERKRTTFRHLSKFVSKEGKIETRDLNEPLEEKAAPTEVADSVKKLIIEKYFGKPSVPTNTNVTINDTSGLEHKGHVGKSIVLHNLFFAAGGTHLLEESMPALNELYDLMQHMPKMIVEISGHTDSKGGADYNMKLSHNRAQVIVDEIVRRGINQKRMVAKGYGETVPVADNLKKDGSEDAEGMAKNRRVELKVLDLGD